MPDNSYKSNLMRLAGFTQKVLVGEINVNNVLEIKGFKTTDGKIFEVEADAKEHQRKIDLRNRLVNFFDKYGYNNMSKTNVVDIILNKESEFYLLVLGETK